MNYSAKTSPTGSYPNQSIGSQSNNNRGNNGGGNYKDGSCVQVMHEWQELHEKELLYCSKTK